MSKGLNPPAASLSLNLVQGFIDHFHVKNTTLWTTTTLSTGTATVSAGINGVINIVTAATSADDVYLISPYVFKVLAGKPIEFKSLFQYAEAATNVASIYLGLMTSVAADSIQTGTAGPKTNFSGAGFFKQSGQTLWSVIYSDGTTQTIAQLTASNSLTKTAQTAPAAASAFSMFEIDIIPRSSTLVDVIFRIAGSTVYKMTDQTYASAANMAVTAGVKAGSAAAQTINVDAVSCHQKY